MAVAAAIPNFSNFRSNEDGGFCTSILPTAWTSILPPGKTLKKQTHASLSYKKAATIEDSLPFLEEEATAHPVEQLIPSCRELWKINMTALSEILGVTRATLYNWINGKTQPESKQYKHLQNLKVLGEFWRSQGEAAQDYLLDYAGPNANEMTIRSALKDSSKSIRSVEELMARRIEQYGAARARFDEIVGTPAPLPKKPMPESARALSEAFAETQRVLANWQKP